jgi:Zn finger protein HypA/HybF involved in hydrogenase expression
MYYEGSRGMSSEPHETRCEVRCDHCGKTFSVMRLRHGNVKCPVCRRSRSDGHPNWRQVKGE